MPNIYLRTQMHGEQWLAFSASAHDIQADLAFGDLLRQFATTGEPRVDEEGHYRLILEPPIPKQRIEDFGRAVMRLAESLDLSTDPIRFHHSVLEADHTPDNVTAFAPRRDAAV